MRPPNNAFSSLLGHQIPSNIPRFPHRLITENSAAKSAQPHLPTGHQCTAAGCQPAPPATQVAPTPNCQDFQHPTAKPGPNSLANHPYPRIPPHTVPKAKQTAAILSRFAGQQSRQPGSEACCEAPRAPRSPVGAQTKPQNARAEFSLPPNKVPEPQPPAKPLC